MNDEVRKMNSLRKQRMLWLKDIPDVRLFDSSNGADPLGGYNGSRFHICNSGMLTWIPAA